MPRSAGIEISLGDAQDLGKIYGEKRFDVIPVVRALEYFVDPWDSLKQMQRLLRKGGFITVNGFPLTQVFAGDFEKRRLLVSRLRDEFGFKVDQPQGSDNPGSLNILFKKGEGELDFEGLIKPLGIVQNRQRVKGGEIKVYQMKYGLA